MITDCAAFRMTMDKEDLPPRIARWALYLQDFEYILEHRSSNRMKHIDSLSRSPISLVIERNLIEKVSASQMKDDTLKLVAKLLEKGPYEDFIMENNVLYREKDGKRLLCVPKGLQTEIIRSVHEQGHFGQHKMEDLINREYVIPKLKEKIESCRRNCIPCILAERKSGKQEGELHPIPKGEYPLRCYHIDHLGPLTSTKKNYRYILTIIDAFSKFTWIYPVKTLTTAEVIDKLEFQKNIFGNPKHIISDRGAAFTAKDFRDYCDRERIHHTTITTGVPRGNGQVERINHVIISVLTKLSHPNPEDWYKFAGKVQRYINSTWQRSIRKSPFEVMFGVKINNAEDPRLAEAIDEEILQLFDQERDEIREEAKRAILDVQKENQRVYNRKRRQAKQYQPGDLVAIKKTQFGTTLKIYPKFLGPYKIVKANGKDRYDVVRLGNKEGPNATTTSSDNMKPWGLYEETQSSSEDEDLPENEAESVEHIIDKNISAEHNALQPEEGTSLES